MPGRQQVTAAVTLLLPLPSKNERNMAAPKIPFWQVQRGRGWRHQVTTGTSLFRSRFNVDLFASHPGWAVQLHYRRVFFKDTSQYFKMSRHIFVWLTFQELHTVHSRRSPQTHIATKSKRKKVPIKIF